MTTDNAKAANNAAALIIPDGVALSKELRRHDARLVLETPVKHGDRVLEALEFHPCRGVHVRAAPTEWQTTDKVLEVAGLLTTLPDSVLDQVSGADLGALVRTTLSVAWPMIDLPVQWEAHWALERQQAEAARKKAPERALPKVRAGLELHLEKPVTVERDSVGKLVWSEFTGKMARQCPLDGLPISRLPWLVGELTGTRPEVVDQLEGVDLHRALSLAQLFFLRIRPTGAA